jgi:hypothetical protein
MAQGGWGSPTSLIRKLLSTYMDRSFHVGGMKSTCGPTPWPWRCQHRKRATMTMTKLSDKYHGKTNTHTHTHTHTHTRTLLLIPSYPPHKGACVQCHGKLGTSWLHEGGVSKLISWRYARKLPPSFPSQPRLSLWFAYPDENDLLWIWPF